MKYSKFISYQSLILALRGSPPILLFMLFNEILTDDSMSNLLSIWSFGNILSAILLMSANTVAPQYFFKNTTKMQHDEVIKSSYFQVLRFIFLLFFIITLYLLSYFIWNEAYLFTYLVIYNMVLSVLPTWRQYSNRNLSHIFYIEFLFRAPVLLCIALIYFFELDIKLVFYLVLLLSFVGVGYIISDFYPKIKEKNLQKEGLISSFDYISNIVPVNVFLSIFTAGQVFLFSLFSVSNEMIIQAGMLERVKNIFLQAQGVFVSDRLSKNRDLMIEKITLFKYFKANKNAIITSFLATFLAILLSFLGVFNAIFGIDYNNYVINLLMLLPVFTTTLVFIFVSNTLNSQGMISAYRKIFFNAYVILIVWSLIFFSFTSFIFLSTALFLDVVVLLLFFYYNKKKLFF